MITGLPRIAIAMPADEYPIAVDTFRTIFGMYVDDFSPRTVPDLGAHVGMCQPPGGSNIELMAPSDPDAALSMALNRFLDRRGTGPYALMLEAPDPDAEADELALRGMNVLPLMPGATGRDVHPNATHGVLMRVYPTGSVAQPAEPAGDPRRTVRPRGDRLRHPLRHRRRLTREPAGLGGTHRATSRRACRSRARSARRSLPASRSPCWCR